MIADNIQPQGKPETRRFRGKLARNLMAILIPLTIIPTFIMGLVSFIRTRTTLIDQISEQLNDVLLQETYDLDNWLIKKQARLSKTAGDQGFLTAAQDLFESQSGSYTHETSHSIVLEKLRSINPSLTNPVFSQFMLLDINGTVLAATKSKWEGLDLSGEDYFSQNVLGSESAAFFAIDLTTLYPPSQTSESGLNINSNIIQISSYQLFDNQDNQLGYIIGIADVFSIQSVLETNSGYLPESKIFLYTEDGHFIGMTMLYGLIVIDPSEDQNNIILGDPDPGAPASALKSYNGEDVFGLYDFYSRLNSGILVEAPQTKVFSQINSLAPFFLLLAFVTILVIAALIFLGAQRFTKPIIRLTESAREVAAGNLDIRVDISGDDEIGELSSAFNSMASQLNNLIANLEQQVSERTMELQKHAAQLITAAEVARDATSEIEMEDLLERAADLIRDKFSFYHVAIYLMDQREEYAIIVAGGDLPGKQLKESEHRYRVSPDSNVGRVCTTGESLLTSTDNEATQVTYHPLLPNTNAQMILPLKVAGKTLGVIDIHSTNPKTFKEGDVAIFQTMVDQLAVAIQKTEFRDEIQETLHELETAYGFYTRESWHRFIQGKDTTTGYRYRQLNIEPIGETPTEVAEAWNQGETIIQEGVELTEVGKLSSTIAVPMKVRGEVIGVLDLHLESDQVPSDTSNLVQEIAGRLSLVLENARLVESAQQRLDRERLIGEITNKIRQTLDMDTVLRTAAQEIGESLGLAEVEVRMGQFLHSSTSQSSEGDGDTILASQLENI